MTDATIGVCLVYRFADKTEMTFRMSEVFTSCRSILEAMIRIHGSAEVIEPGPRRPFVTDSPNERLIDMKTRIELMNEARRLEREARQNRDAPPEAA